MSCERVTPEEEELSLSWRAQVRAAFGDETLPAGLKAIVGEKRR